VLALGLLASCINALGIWSLGGLNNWVRWFQDHRPYFLLWRIVLYSATVYGWLRMRRRVLSTEPDTAAAARFMRAEFAAIAAVILIEAIVFLQGP
jgi:hypothetical protein